MSPNAYFSMSTVVDRASVDVSGRSRRTAIRRGRRRGGLVSDATPSALRDAREDPSRALRCEARETAARGAVFRRDARCAGRRERSCREGPPRAGFGQRKTTPQPTIAVRESSLKNRGTRVPRARVLELQTRETRHHKNLSDRFFARRASRFRAMAEYWSVRRARDAGEALRPARKTESEDHDDDVFPASRDARSAARSRRAAPTSAAPAPRLGPIVALVTRRDRVQHVYCKRTNETVPCVALRLADDTFDGLRVVLWRAHAAADVGAERHERAVIVGTPRFSRAPTAFFVCFARRDAILATPVSYTHLTLPTILLV